MFFICCCCSSLLPQLNFIGVTVDPDSFYVHFANTRHLFEPVPVGGTSPPVQVYELYNGGARVVKYELDMEPLAQIQAVSILITRFFYLFYVCVCVCAIKKNIYLRCASYKEVNHILPLPDCPR